MAENWQKNMSKAQKQWWDAWSNMGKKAMGGEMKNPFAASPFNAWADPMGMWKQSAFPMANLFNQGGMQNPFAAMMGGAGNANPFAMMGAMGAMNPFAAMMGGAGQNPAFNPFAMGDQFKTMTESILGAFQKAQKNSGAMKNWNKAIKESIETAKAFYGKTDNAAAVAAMVSNLWSQAGNGLMGKMGMDAASGFAPFTDKLQAGMDQLLSMPGLGPNRESQEKLQEGMKHYLDFQQALSEQMTLLGPLPTKSLDKLQKRLLKAVADKKPVQTPMQVYAMWVDASEDAYEEIVSNKAFNEVNARVTNALNRVKIFQQGLWNQQLAEMNMPTRTEVDTSHKRMMELKKAVKNLEAEVKMLKTQSSGDALGEVREEIDKLGVDKLKSEAAKEKAEVRELKKELTALKKQMENRPPRREFETLKRQVAKLMAVPAPAKAKAPAQKAPAKTAAKKAPAKKPAVKKPAPKK